MSRETSPGEDATQVLDAAPRRLDSTAARAPEDAGSLPRLLKGIAASGEPLGLQQHLRVHGELHLPRRRGRERAAELIEQVERAGLRGRGGAAFPTGRKLRAVAAGRGRPVVVVNAAEGEPASDKDRALGMLTPHLVIDGVVAAGRALDAREAIVGVCESSAAAATIARALGERSGDGMQIELTAIPASYVAGQESALVAHLNGARAVPTFTPPMPFERGVARRPTLVSNAETFANIALIARHGEAWFRSLGTTEHPGSALVTLSGPVAAPAVYEIEQGTGLHALIGAAGGLLAPIRAVLLGGYAGTWIDGSAIGRLALADGSLERYGARLGAGVVALLSREACPVAETARVTRWLAQESAGQCGPCVHGLHALASAIAELATGVGPAEDAPRRIERLAGLVRGRGACTHPDGTARFALSALEVFAEEFADHAYNGRCDRCGAMPELPLSEGVR